MIYINDIPSLRDPESLELFVEDRIEKVELIGGNAVQDYGHVESGDVFSLECVFHTDNWGKIETLWKTRTPVSFTDVAGIIWTNLRIVVKSIRYESKFPQYVRLKFELWKI